MTGLGYYFLDQLSALLLGHSWLKLLLLGVLPVYFLGAITGLMLPRPTRWMEALLSSLMTNQWSLKGTALTINGVLIVRECCDRFLEHGSFFMLIKAIFFWLCGKGWMFDFPRAASSATDKVAAHSSFDEAQDEWYVNSSDLQFFKNTVESDCDGRGKWEPMMEKNLPNLVLYKAWRRTLPNGKSEYKTMTVCPDATAEEFSDFYLDDDARPIWDTMIVKHDILERGDAERRELAVRWVRKFPFSFITDREYILARRLFRVADDPSGGAQESLYGISKAVSLPSAAQSSSSVVKTEVFYSMWRSRNVACPWASGRPACQTLLIHHEQLKIPENLSRFAARHGMWSFVKKMSMCVEPFVTSRRLRCAPHERDPTPYGFKDASSVPTPRMDASEGKAPFAARFRSASQLMWGAAPLAVINEDSVAVAGSPSHMSPPAQRGKTLRGIATFAVASSLAAMLKHSNSSGSLSISSYGGLPPSTNLASKSYTNLASANLAGASLASTKLASNNVTSKSCTNLAGVEMAANEGSLASSLKSASSAPIKRRRVRILPRAAPYPVW